MNKQGCILCNTLMKGNKFSILQRNRYANDNLEDILKEETDYRLEPIEEESSFTLDKIFMEEWKQNYLSFTFNDKYDLDHNKELLIKRFSELVPLNFCFVCGRQLTENGKMINEDDYRIEIEEYQR